MRFHAELRRFAPAGTAVLEAELPDGARVADLLARYPALGVRRIVVGLNGELAPSDAALRDGDRVDLLTPMSGG